MDNFSDTVLAKNICCSSQNRSLFWAIWQLCLIIALKNYVGSHEEQDGSKQNFVGTMMAKLKAVFHLYVVENTEKMKIKNFNLAEEGNFLASFNDWDHKNRNFMVSNTVVILLL